MRKDKKIIQEEMKRKCPDYIEKKGMLCLYIGKHSGRCFKCTNPLLPCKIISDDDRVGMDRQADFLPEEDVRIKKVKEKGVIIGEGTDYED